jgi:hypothetical protein
MKRDKGRLPQFVPLLVSTLDSRAWRAMSHGARSLYVALKRRVPKDRNTAYVSYRDAVKELRSSQSNIGESFRELHHYGFIALAAHGSLGFDGKGRAPLWRLTEKGQTSGASAGGLFEPPTNDFLKWDGTRFQKRKHKKQKPASYVRSRVLPTSEAVALPTKNMFPFSCCPSESNV